MSFFFGGKTAKAAKAAKKEVDEDEEEEEVVDTKDSKKEKEDDDGEEEAQTFDAFDAIKQLCLNEALSDVHFVVGKPGAQERIPAHRLILSAGNPVLRALLYPLEFSADGKAATYNSTSECKDITIENVTPSAFKKMLTAIYTDELEVTADDVTELIGLAKRFHVEVLKAMCVEFMEQDVTAEKACVLFVEGRKLLNEPAFGLSFIEENFEDITKTDGFVDLPRDCLDSILRSNKLAIDEADLWSAVDKWAAAECKRLGTKPDGTTKREALGGLLQLVRFPLIEMQELCTKVQPTNVLSQDELLSLFTYAAAPENAKPKTAFSAREREGGGSRVQVHEFKWSDKLSNSARVRCEGMKLTSIAPTCNRDVLGIADTKGWSRGVHYWRINHNSGGCYRRIGIVDGEFDKTKYGDGGPAYGMPAVLGATANSWGANLVSAHNFGEPNVFSGACGRFNGGEVGVLLDLNKKKMHLFANGQFVATAFTNIKGKKIRPAIQMCHNASFVQVMPAKGTPVPQVPK